MILHILFTQRTHEDSSACRSGTDQQRKTMPLEDCHILQMTDSDRISSDYSTDPSDSHGQSNFMNNYKQIAGLWESFLKPSCKYVINLISPSPKACLLYCYTQLDK
ncbi:hypothetical protein NPIL_502341 [Nephila pilipes]|uniref:Uncharacterized protein n=1 Tax=Nephila pilipes TaxID=299642 RepID=A0A8X6JWM1_NEPPI|nr:hypothetical protein NPIL_502341 [Nephila pilipes]